MFKKTHKTFIAVITKCCITHPFALQYILAMECDFLCANVLLFSGGLEIYFSHIFVYLTEFVNTDRLWLQNVAESSRNANKDSQRRNWERNRRKWYWRQSYRNRSYRKREKGINIGMFWVECYQCVIFVFVLDTGIWLEVFSLYPWFFF